MIRRVLTCLSFGGILFPALFSLALAGPWFRIQKSDAVPESTASFQWVTFNDTCPGKRFPTFTWSQNLALFFPQSETGPRQTYQLSIDLKNLGGHQLLSVAEFLAALGHAPDINSYTPVLHIKNGTSFKFNRIFEGIKIFFQSTPRAQVVYHHQGIGEPRAARQGLASLSELAIDPPHSIDHLRDLTQEISDLWLHSPSHISEEGARARSPSVFSETSGETVPHQEATLFPETLLQKKIQYTEVTENLEQLQDQWTALAGGAWPPLGLTNLNQIRKVYIDNLDTLGDALPTPPPIILDVSGVHGEEHHIADYCRNTPSIRCVRIQDSTCDLDSLSAFWHRPSPDLNDESSAEGEEASLLSPDRIQFLDVRAGVLQLEGGLESLPDNFVGRKKALLNYIMWAEPTFHSFFQNLPPSIQTPHLIFDLVCRYIQMLEAEFGNTQQEPR